MLNRRFFISGIVTTTAAVTASQFLPAEWPKPYATVYGVGWDLEVVEHDVWTQQDALKFAKFGVGGIDLFREITDIVYNVPMEPLPETYKNSRGAYAIDPLLSRSKPVQVQDNGFTNITSFRQIWAWQDSLRPDLPRDFYGDQSVEWVQHQIKCERDYEANAARYIDEAIKGTSNV
jgi:hypothetical protein